LNTFDGLPAVALVPISVERFGRDSQLGDKIAGQVLRLDLAALLPPQTQEGGFAAANNDPGVGAANEAQAIKRRVREPRGLERNGHDALQFSCSIFSAAWRRITRSASAVQFWKN